MRAAGERSLHRSTTFSRPGSHISQSVALQFPFLFPVTTLSCATLTGNLHLYMTILLLTESSTDQRFNMMALPHIATLKNVLS
jgi:hypothetical protein